MRFEHPTNLKTHGAFFIRGARHLMSLETKLIRYKVSGTCFRDESKIYYQDFS
jgi:hypothetical protein